MKKSAICDNSLNNAIFDIRYDND